MGKEAMVSNIVETIIGGILMGAWVIALELVAVHTYTGGMPWQ